MKTLAIFGDSYAGYNPNSKFKSWVDYLRSYTDIKIDNYGECGSSLYFSWREFQNHHEKYSHCFFIVTSWDRFLIEDPEIAPRSHIAGFNHLETTLSQQELSTDYRHILLALRDYRIKGCQDSYRKDMHRLMIRDLKATRPDIVMVPGFNEYISLFSIPGEPNLWDIGIIDIQKLFPKEIHKTWADLYECRRQNHLNDVNNQLLALAVKNWLDTGVFTLSNVQWTADPNAKSYDYYFVKK